MTVAPGALILVVEDSDDMREALGEVLTGEGYRVANARDGQEALDWLATGALPDVVLLDLKMRGMNGEAFLARFREDPRLAEVPVLITSGSAAPDPALPAQAFLAKPVAMDQLIEALSRFTQRS